MADSPVAEAAEKMAAATLEQPVAPSPAVDGAAGGADGKDKGGSKSAAKKDAKAQKKAERLAARQQQQQSSGKEDEADPLACNYGDVAMEDVQSKAVSGRRWTPVAQLTDDLVGQVVLVRARVHSVRAKGKMGFVVLREGGCTVQCVLAVTGGGGEGGAKAEEGGAAAAGDGGAVAGEGGVFVSKGMVKYAGGLSRESVVDVEGLVVKPEKPIESCTQQVELHVRTIRAITRANPVLPLSIEDASRSEKEIEEGEKAGLQYVRVLQDTRLNHRVLDLRTPASQAIFRLQSMTGQLFREFFYANGFMEIHTPKLIAGSSEGGAAVFRLEYKGRPACLAQSPQLYKQMAICADFGRVFEIGPVFRAEDSFTHRHLCEFTGVDFEMEIKEHYFEVLDVIDRLFVSIFDGLNQRCQKELAAINAQYPLEPLQYRRDGLRITFAEGVAMLKEAGVEIDPFGDINTEQERRLGQLVKAKFGTDFYIMHRYPMAVRPFYTMPCPDDPRYSNSFDVFIRGEEIISGAQRIHEPELLTVRAKACGIDVATISSYIDSFRFGAVPHGGVGVGLERVVMLFCALNNIRKVSMFPRDPQRLTP